MPLMWISVAGICAELHIPLVVKIGTFSGERQMIIMFSVMGLMVGAALGQAYRAFVLLPTSLVLVVAAINASLLKGHDSLATLLGVATILAALQLGYLLGLVACRWRLPLPSPMLSSARRGVHGHARQPWATGRR